MAEEKKTAEKVVKADAKSLKGKVDKQAFVQRKLLVLNLKDGARYQRDADRVVQANREVQ